ncbi:exodeoxyribonuclease VII large subunit [soil metagenome]
MPAAKVSIKKHFMNPITVSELTRNIKILIENEFSFVYLEGEISNFKIHTSSGHYYFSLKDSTAQISAAMWSTRNILLGFIPENGMKVTLKGKVKLFERSGQYNIDVYEMKVSGDGDLFIKFEALKNKLREEGLFEAAIKKPLPKYPNRIGLITSESGAVIHDILKVGSKRFPLTSFLLFPVNVQGPGAIESIVRAINLANDAVHELDIILIARGGGSMEDLWTFNEEAIARCIFSSILPVVSAIGHESDFTIADFVSDRRSPTPSAAIEEILPDMYAIFDELNNYERNLISSLTEKIEGYRYSLNSVENNYFFRKPVDKMNDVKIELDIMQDNIENILKEKLFNLNSVLDSTDKLFHHISPEITLKRGYTMIKKNGKVISNADELKKDDEIEINFYKKSKEAKVI